MYRIGDLFIDPELVELIPESVARENGVLPLSASGRELHVLIADQGNVEELLEKLTFILNREIIHEVADPGAVYEMVDTLFSMSRAVVTRCNLRFELTCSRRWLELVETDRPEERHCPDCRETVYHCETEAQALQHAARGHCVCLHDSLTETEVCETMGLMIFTETDPASPEGLKKANRGGRFD